MRPSPVGIVLALLALGTVVATGQEPAGQHDSSGARRRVFPVPVVAYAPETGLQLGVAVVAVWSPSLRARARPSTALLTAVYTVKHQYTLSLWTDRWSRGDRWHVTGEVGLTRFPSGFHGIGAAATDSSEPYTPQTAYLTASVQRRLGRQVYIGAGYAIRHTRMVETAPGGLLAAGTIVGSRGGTEAVVTLEGILDTRDALYMTRRGAYLRLAGGAAGAAVGADHAYRRLTGDVRAYRAVGPAVVAAQLFVDATDGAVPFELLPRLGGQSLLRGYTEPRFRDGAMGAGQVEVRAPVAGIFGAAIFLGAGTTAPSFADLSRGVVRVTGGVGTRILLDRAAGLQLRLDYAWARGGGAFYVAAGDAF